jgi:hypothetical protein
MNHEVTYNRGNLVGRKESLANKLKMGLQRFEIENWLRLMVIDFILYDLFAAVITLSIKNVSCSSEESNTGPI